MKIMGLHVTGSQSSAVICDNGLINAAAAEERFDRIKQSRAFPKSAIRYCLKEAGLNSLEDLDFVAISWNPAENMRNINLTGFTQWRRYDPEWLYIVPNHLMAMAGKQAFQGDCLEISMGERSKTRLVFVNHHMAHLAHAVFQSPFESGLAICADEYGEFDSVSIASFKGKKINLIKKIHYPNSLGVFYAAITEYAGFTPNSDEWKLMGAAAYGNPKRLEAALDTLLEWDEKEGEWILDTRFIEHSNMKRAGYMNERLQRLLKMPPRKPCEELSQRHFDLAAAAQAVFEKRIFQLITHYAKSTGETRLAASGGCFMNCLSNGRVIGKTPIKNLFVPYAAADNGGAMGAALWTAALHEKQMPRHKVSPSPYLGPEYSDSEIAGTLKKYKISAKKSGNPAKDAAKAIASGKIVGWFQGRMEFGERVLGNRSILADPRNPKIKDLINAAVKYREAFRPFAPSVLAEKAREFFDLPENESVPYMEKAYNAKKGKAPLIPAVVHHDGTCRLQTVDKKLNPVFHKLISEFEKLSGIPIVLNTSFNVQGEPIAMSPSDAIRTFSTSGMDILFLGSFILEKQHDGEKL